MNKESLLTKREQQALVAGERVLDEISEKLQEVFDRSHEWFETVMLSVGFFLLTVAAKASEEMEILGVKVNIEGDYRKVFLLIIAGAMVFRLIQNWILTRLSDNALHARFNDVALELIKARDALAIRAVTNMQVSNRATEALLKRSQLPSSLELFDDTEVLEGYDKDGNLKVFSCTPEQLQNELRTLIQVRRGRLEAAGLADWYPIELWHRTAEATIQLSVEERKELLRSRPVVLFSTAEDDEKELTLSEKAQNEIQNLRSIQKQAVQALEDAIEAQVSESLRAVETTGAGVQALVSRLDGINRKANFYYRLAKFGRYFNLALPTLAAIIAAIATLTSGHGA